jgi:hypothetical protein
MVCCLKYCIVLFRLFLVQKRVNPPVSERPDVPSSHCAMRNRHFIYTTAHSQEGTVRRLNAVCKACGFMQHHGSADFFDCSSWSSNPGRPMLTRGLSSGQYVVGSSVGSHSLAGCKSRLKTAGAFLSRASNSSKRYDGCCFSSSSRI